MRVVVVGATGNVGTSLLEALAADPAIDEVVGIAKRRPAITIPKTTWAVADISTDDLVPHLRGADAVVHLAWLIQPSHELDLLRRTNVDGSERVFRATAEAGVPSLVYASSIAVYSPGPKTPVDESWPTGGTPSSYYSRHKVETERQLDRLEAEHPDLRVVRLRKALIFKQEAATEIHRYFFGPLVPRRLLHPERVPVVPRHPRLVFQAVHSADVAEAYRLSLHADVRGAFNIAADPIIDSGVLAEALGARAIRVPGALVRLAADMTWRLRLQPTAPGWLDMAVNVPVMDTSRARRELGWSPRHRSTDALRELFEGIGTGSDAPTPPLSKEAA